MIRRILKQMFAASLYYSGLLILLSAWRRGRAPGGDLVILMYHRVLANPADREEYTSPAMAVSTAMFERQIAFLKANRSVISLDDLVSRLVEGKPLPQRCAVITFDDGWRDNLANAYPILRLYGLPATIFVTAEFVGSRQMFWFHAVRFLLTDGILSASDQAGILKDAYGASDRPVLTDLSPNNPAPFIIAMKGLSDSAIQKVIGELERRTGLGPDRHPSRNWTLSWEEIQSMDPKLIEIGSHGMSHRILTGLDRNEIIRELSESKKVIEDRLGRPVTSFAYPNGDSSPEIRELTRAAGYSSGMATEISTKSGTTPDLFCLPRVNLHEDVAAGVGEKFSVALFALHLHRGSASRAD